MAQQQAPQQNDPQAQQLQALGVQPQHLAQLQAKGIAPADLLDLLGKIVPALIDWLSKRQSNP